MQSKRKKEKNQLIHSNDLKRHQAGKRPAAGVPGARREKKRQHGIKSRPFPGAVSVQSAGLGSPRMWLSHCHCLPLATRATSLPTPTAKNAHWKGGVCRLNLFVGWCCLVLNLGPSMRALQGTDASRGGFAGCRHSRVGVMQSSSLSRD